VGFIAWNLLALTVPPELPRPLPKDVAEAAAASVLADPPPMPPPVWPDGALPAAAAPAVDAESPRKSPLSRRDLASALKTLPQPPQEPAIPAPRHPAHGAGRPPPYAAPAEAKQPPALSVSELNSQVLGRLVAAYEQGDPGALAALLSEHAVAGRQSGREAIRREYARVFAGAVQRELRLGQFHWQIDNQSAIGSGTFNLRVTAIEQDTQSSYEGTLTIDVGQGPDGLLIIGVWGLPSTTPP
jgi:hypothetical protein